MHAPQVRGSKPQLKHGIHAKHFEAAVTAYMFKITSRGKVRCTEHVATPAPALTHQEWTHQEWTSGPIRSTRASRAGFASSHAICTSLMHSQHKRKHIHTHGESMPSHALRTSLMHRAQAYIVCITYTHENNIHTHHSVQTACVKPLLHGSLHATLRLCWHHPCPN